MVSGSCFRSYLSYLTKNIETDADAHPTDQERIILNQLSESYNSLKTDSSDVKDSTLDMMNSMFSYLNHRNKKIQTVAYETLLHLANQMDRDELAEAMMDQLICLSWDGSFEEAVRLATAYAELFGKGLEKMNRSRDWMLFIPFLSNHYIKCLDYIENALVENAASSTATDQAVFLFAHNYLDFLEFIDTKTVTEELTEFPFDSHDIGSESSDVRRRYLVFSLLTLFYEKIVAHFELQSSKVYFKTFHTSYNLPNVHPNKLYTPSELVTNIIDRCRVVASRSGLEFEKLQQLQQSLNDHMNDELSREDIAMLNDRQMINSRLYPISHKGLAILASLSLYDNIILERKDVAFWATDDKYLAAKRCIGMLLDLTLSPTKHVQQADKGVFVLLYLADNIKATVTMDDIEKEIKGPLGYQSEFSVSQIIQVLSSVASTCPDQSIRFYAYKLIEKFLQFCTDETRFFFLTELIEHCPFPSMNTAAIGLLKDQVAQSFKQTKEFSMFCSPLLLSRFFPIIFQVKQDYKTNLESFWDDLNHIMQALNFYYFLLQVDRSSNITTVWNQDQRDWIKSKYLSPLTSLLENLSSTPIQEMQIATMTYTIDNIQKAMQ